MLQKLLYAKPSPGTNLESIEKNYEDTHVKLRTKLTQGKSKGVEDIKTTALVEKLVDQRKKVRDLVD